MFISKFWYLLLATIAGTALAAIFLAQELYNRERFDDLSELLYKDQSETEVALNLFARRRLDALTSITVNAKVRERLMQVSGKPDLLSYAREELLPVLRAANIDLGKYSGDFLSALDRRGRVVAQVGYNEQFSGYRLTGFPLVRDVLRGKVRDDAWALDSDIFLVAGRPVIQAGQYVGAVIHGFKLSNEFANKLSKSLGAQVAFFHGNLLLGLSHLPGSKNPLASEAMVAEPVPELLKTEKFASQRISDILPLKNRTFFAIYTRMMGEARNNDAMYAVIRPFTPMTEPWGFVEGGAEQDVKALPWIYLVLGVLVAFGLGFLWNRLELEWPLKRFHTRVEGLQPNENERLNVYLWRGRLRRLATSVNEAIDKAVAAINEVRTPKQSKSIEMILGAASAAGAPAPDKYTSAAFRFSEPGASEVPPPPPVPEKPIQTASGSGSPPPRKPMGLKVPSKAPPAQATPPGVKAFVSGASIPISTGNTAVKSPSSLSLPVVSAEDAKAPLPGTPDELVYFKETYEKFMILKKKLGEPAENLSFDRFKDTLEKNRDALIARYQCKAVAFQVYEKAGKASLKALPIRS